MAEKINAYSYLRISSDQQKVGDGIRRQMDMSKEYAERHGYNLVEQMSDIGISAFKGKNISEGALGVFIDAIQAGKIQPGSVLLVESLDRLSRDRVLKAFSQFTNILEKGVGIVTLTDEQHYTAESVSSNVGQLFMSLGVMLRANEESVTKSKRIKAAWKRKRETIGEKKLTSMVPAWLVLDENRKDIHIIEAKADIVRMIFDLSLGGMGIYSITRHLNVNHAKCPPITNAAKWNHSYINKILENRAVYGLLQPKIRVDGAQVDEGGPIENYYPVIISKDIFNLVQSRNGTGSNRTRGRKGDKFTNLFTGLVKCGTCGGTVGLKNKGKPPKGFKYLRCENSIQNHNCNAPAWRYEGFEEPFIDFVKEIKFSILIGDSDATSKNLEALKATALSKAAKLTTAYNALLSQFENPDFPPQLLTSLISRSKELLANIEAEQEEVKELEFKIARQTHEDIDSEQKDFLSAYEAIRNSNDTAQLRKMRYAMHGLLKRHIDEVTIYNDFELNPLEITDVMSKKLKAHMGGKTDEELEDYFSKPHGKRLYAESERFFVVKFKSGAIRAVQPFENKTFMSISERLAKMRNSSRSLSGNLNIEIDRLGKSIL